MGVRVRRVVEVAEGAGEGIMRIGLRRGECMMLVVVEGRSRLWRLIRLGLVMSMIILVVVMLEVVVGGLLGVGCRVVLGEGGCLVDRGRGGEGVYMPVGRDLYQCQRSLIYPKAVVWLGIGRREVLTMA